MDSRSYTRWAWWAMVGCVCALSACLPGVNTEDDDRPSATELEESADVPPLEFPTDANVWRPRRRDVGTPTMQTTNARLWPHLPGKPAEDPSAELDAGADAREDVGEDATDVADATRDGGADAADRADVLGWFGPDVPVAVGALLPPGAGAADGGPTPVRFTWANEGVEAVSEVDVPVAIDPSGAVYIARSRVAALRRIVRGEDLARSVVVGFDADGRVAMNVPASGGLRVVPRGLVADAAGVYALATYTRAVELNGRRLDAPTGTGWCVIAFDRAGIVRWVRSLDATQWQPGSFLTGRVADRLVVAGVARGRLGVGMTSVGSATTPRVLRVDLARASGDVLGAWDLADGTTNDFQGDLNARGELLASLRTEETATLGEFTTVRLARATLFTPEGAARWSLTVPVSSVALDDQGGSYVVGTGVNAAWGPSPDSRRMCVAALDAAGRGRWIADLGGVSFYSSPPRVAWRDEALDVFTQDWSRMEWWGISGPSSSRCIGWSFSPREARIDAEGWRLGGADALNPALARFSGAGRRCDLSVSWTGTICGVVPLSISSGALTCSRATGPTCAWGSSPCGALCKSLDSDPDHCGACGRSCAGAFPHAAGYCREGACVYGVCDPGHASCDASPTNGCETDLARDNAHCGRCGNACPAGAVCNGGRCCAGGLCAAPFTSDGHEGALAPTADVTLAPGVHQYTTITIPAGVTVRTEPGATLDLRATGDVRVDGAIDLRGRDSVACCGSAGMAACATPAPAGASPGVDGLTSLYGNCTSPAESWSEPSVPPLLPREYTDAPRGIYVGNCGGHNDTPPGWTLYYGSTASSGSIGLEAFEDLAVNRVFAPGSRGGSFSGSLSGEYFSGECRAYSGGGGGGALRVASPTRILVGASGRLLASGGARSSGAAGSGGVVVVHAPEVRVPAGAVLDASGGTPGRLRVAVDPARCELAGTLRPPLVDGCTPTPPERAVARAFVTRWPL